MTPDQTHAPAASGYAQLIRANPWILSFGFLMALGSSFGQTFFIGVFGPAIETTFGLSHAGWGSIYMAGTLLSALLLPFTGRLIDRMPLARYAILVCIGLAAATLAAALCPAAIFLIPVVFLLRQSGQGLASHVAITAMVKAFDRNRGKAVAIATLGFPAGRAVMPFCAVAAIAAIGWRATFALSAVLVVVLMIPAVIWLLRRDTASRPAGVELEDGPPVAARGLAVPDRTLGEVLRHPFFYLILPGILGPSFIETALFFHQLSIAESKGWSAEWVTAGYAVFALMTTLVTLMAGPLIDRIGATRLLPLVLMPLVVGVLVLAYLDHAIWAWVYLALAGIGSGAMRIVQPVMFAELFGTGHIGAIRSAAATLSVFASALGPPALGLMMDAGIAFAPMGLGAALYLVAASLVMWYACRYRR
jgi:MFS family permease